MKTMKAQWNNKIKRNLGKFIISRCFIISYQHRCQLNVQSIFQLQHSKLFRRDLMGCANSRACVALEVQQLQIEDLPLSEIVHPSQVSMNLFRSSIVSALRKTPKHNYNKWMCVFIIQYHILMCLFPMSHPP